MEHRFKLKDIIIVHDPIRLYTVTKLADNGYHLTYIGPGTQTVENALVSMALRTEKHVRLATKAEIVLYVKRGDAAAPL